MLRRNSGPGGQGGRILVLLAMAQALWAAPLFAQKVPVKEVILDNGMRLLMVERHDEPSVAGGWVAHAGSSNERTGMTGIAHLFEHMMFKGTPTIGTTDYKKDLEILAEQEKVRDEMRKEYRLGEIDDVMKPENKTPRWRELKNKFGELVLAERKVIVKNEFDQVY